MNMKVFHASKLMGGHKTDVPHEIERTVSGVHFFNTEDSNMVAGHHYMTHAVQLSFKMLSKTSGTTKCPPPRLSDVVPMLPSEQY